VRGCVVLCSNTLKPKPCAFYFFLVLCRRTSVPQPGTRSLGRTGLPSIEAGERPQAAELPGVRSATCSTSAAARSIRSLGLLPQHCCHNGAARGSHSHSPICIGSPGLYTIVPEAALLMLPNICNVTLKVLGFRLALSMGYEGVLATSSCRSLEKQWQTPFVLRNYIDYNVGECWGSNSQHTYLPHSLPHSVLTRVCSLSH